MGKMKKSKFILIICIIILLAMPLSAYPEVINKVVAVVNDEVITQQDIDQLLAVLYAQFSQSYKSDVVIKKMEEAKKDILNQVIEDKLVLSRAKELGLKVTDAEVDDKLNSVKSGFPSEKEFEDTIASQGITLAVLKDRYKDQIMMKKLVDYEIKAGISVLPSEISGYYEKHREDFKRDEKYKIKNILIKASDEVGFELARIEIAGIYNKLKEGYSFDEIAKSRSQGASADNSGDMGYIGRGEMREDLEKVIFKLKSGEFSEPVKSDIGYHIFKVEDIKNNGYFSLDEVNKDIQLMIFQQKFKDKLKEWLDNLKSKAYISIK